MKRFKAHILLALIALAAILLAHTAKAQDCGANVPVFDVDMSSDPNMTWLSPFVQREDNCCGTTAPDKCVAFVITLHPDAEGIIFDICDGAISPGAMFYQVNCGPQIAVGTSICLDGTGPHYLTFCKPGNNQNVYCITSVAEPGISPDTTIGYSCDTELSVWGFDPAGLTWNSVSPGSTGQYNNFLSCTTCTEATIVSQVNSPITIEYEVCGSPLGGCESMDTCVYVSVTLLPTLSVSIFPTTPIVCFGEATTQVTATGYGGTVPYYFNWSTGATGPVADLPPGPAWVQVTDLTGCGSYTHYFNVLATTTGPLANAGADQVICDPAVAALVNGSISNAEGGQWSGGQGIWTLPTTVLANQYQPTLYEVQNGVTLTLTTLSSNGCPVVSDQVFLAPGALLGSFSADIDPAGCAGGDDGAILLSYSGNANGLIYDWSTGDGGIGVNSISGLSAGSYTVFVENTMGCDTTLSFIVDEPEQLVLDVSNGGTICPGDFVTISASASGGTGPYAFSWSMGLPAGSQHMVNPTVSTTYQVSVTDANGCQEGPGEITVTVLPDTPPYISAGADIVLCEGGPVFLDGTANGASSFTWSGGNGNWSYAPGTLDNVYTPTAEELQTGVTLTVLAISDNGCAQAMDDITLLPGVLPSVITPAVEHVSCFGENDGAISLTFTGAASNLTFDWSTGTAGPNATMLYGLVAGTYSVDIVSAYGCDTTMNFTVLQPSPLGIGQLVQEDITCFGYNNGSLFVMPSGGTGPYEVSLTGPSVTYTGTVIEDILPGTYLLEVADAEGCEVSDNITFEEPQAIYASVSGAATICPGTSVEISVSAIGGTGQLHCNWNMGLPDQDIHVVTPDVTTTYIVTVFDDNGCTAGPYSIPVEVMILTESGLNMNGIPGVCEGEVAQVSAQFSGAYGPYSYQWSHGLGNQPGTFFTYPTEDTWYHFTVYDICGNHLEDSVLVQVYEVPVLILPGNLGQGCAPHTITPGEYIDGGEGWTWNWSFGDGFFSYSEDPTYTYQQAGSFEVSVMATTADGCVAYSTGNGTVNVFETPSADIIADPMITTLANPTITFVSDNAGDDVTSEWSFENDIYTTGHIVEYTYSDTGTYWVTLNVVNEFGCASTEGVYIIVQPEYELIIPNVFTPNPEFEGDGYYGNGLNNDIFYPFTSYVDKFEMQIFNRWGELIFETSDIGYGWNGYYRGRLCQQDVYAYKIKVTHTDGKVVTKLGDITLLR